MQAPTNMSDCFNHRHIGDSYINYSTSSYLKLLIYDKL